MNKKILSLMLIVVNLFAFASLSSAQFNGSTKKITVEYTNTDVREAIMAILHSANISYSIYPEVQGQITLSVKEVPLENVLENILRQVDCTYEYTAGLIVIKKRKEEIIPEVADIKTSQPNKPTKVIRRIIMRSADPLLISMLLSGSQNYFGSPEPIQSSYLSTGFGMNGMFSGMGAGMNGFGGMTGNGGFGQSGAPGNRGQ